MIYSNNRLNRDRIVFQQSLIHNSFLLTFLHAFSLYSLHFSRISFLVTTISISFIFLPSSSLLYSPHFPLTFLLSLSPYALSLCKYIIYICLYISIYLHFDCYSVKLNFMANDSLNSPPMIASPAVVDDSFEDACSICLEPFNSDDPPDVCFAPVFYAFLFLFYFCC